MLLMAHGTPSSLDEMPEYLRLVRGGRPASDELIHEMRENYAAIGGQSPLTEITEAQAGALRARLGPEIPVAVGMRNWRPFIKDALANPTSSSSSPRTAYRSGSSHRAIGMPTKSRRRRAAWPIAPASCATNAPIRAPAARPSRGSDRRSIS
ncbi:MAG: ferrochelatase [Acidobacteria bacterium]|nr:ferrochelatase [Acidobacteriota bacterium]